jgi:hypothetical protein
MMNHNSRSDDADNHEPEDDLSSEEIDRLLEQCKELLAGVDKTIGDTSNQIDNSFRELCGQSFEQMLKSKEFALECMNDPDFNLRRAAIHVALHHWHLISFIADKCEKQLFADPHPKVRQDALRALGDCYSGTRDVRVGRLLAKLVQDEAQPDDFRIGAYLSLVSLHGEAYKYFPCIPLVTLDQLDMTLVRHYDCHL